MPNRLNTWPRLLTRLLNAPSGQVAVAAVIVAAVIVVSTAHTQWRAYERTIDRVERDTRNVAHLLAEHAGQTLGAIAETLQAVDRLRHDVARGIYRSQASIFVHLKTLQGGSPMLSEVGWFDVYGERVASSREFDPPRTSAAARELFRIPRGETSDRLHVAAPEPLVGDEKGWVINLSRRLENLDGSFGGVASGSVDPASFAALFRSLELGPGYAVTMLRRDGIVLAHVPTADGMVGGKWPDAALFDTHLPGTGSATYRTDGIVDGATHLASVATVPLTGGRILINVGVARTDALADFRLAAVRDLVEAALGLVLVVFGARLLVGGLRRREELQRELAIATQRANAARMEAETANRAKSEFLARMSHELLTPLNAVIGFGQMLELDRDRTLSATQKEYCGYILRGGEHLLELINEVLDFASIESGRLSLSLERVCAVDAMQSVGRIMQPVAAKAGVTLDIADVAGLDDIRADSLRLRQILINLVANAIKYNRPDGRVVISAGRGDEGRVRFVVSDTGFGIPAERRDDVFRPFDRLDADGTGVEGTGLGLALSQRLVEAMGGSIDFVSAVGRGSTFWFELPAEGSAATVAPVSERTAPRLASVPEASRFTLLHIEDDPANLRVMERLVGTLPEATLLSAPTPQIGLDLAVVHGPDVIFLDLDLPGSDGRATLARLRATPETRDTPVVALATMARSGKPAKDVTAGFFRYLSKPIDVKAVLEAIAEATGTTNRSCESTPRPPACVAGPSGQGARRLAMR